MGSKSGNTSSSPVLRKMWCTGAWKRRCSCEITGKLPYVLLISDLSDLDHGLEVRHVFDIDRG